MARRKAPTLAQTNNHSDLLKLLSWEKSSSDDPRDRWLIVGKWKSAPPILEKYLIGIRSRFSGHSNNDIGGDPVFYSEVHFSGTGKPGLYEAGDTRSIFESSINQDTRKVLDLALSAVVASANHLMEEEWERNQRNKAVDSAVEDALEELNELNG